MSIEGNKAGKEGNEKAMKFLLTAINAKYIHSNLAVYSLRASALAQTAGRRVPAQAQPAPGAPGAASAPVSYTHLDVYKRQSVQSEEERLWNNIM